MPFTRCATTALLALATTCAGCSGGKIEGRIVPGNAGIVQLVAADKDRPESPGVPAADIELRTVGRAQTGPAFAAGKSGPDGRFSIRYSDRRMVRDRLQLFAKVDGYIPVQEEFFLPQPGQKVLVVMKPTAPGAPPQPAPPPAPK